MGNLKTIFFAILLGLVGLNVVVTPHHPHFGLDAVPGFFAAFGLIAGLVLVVALEKIVRPLIQRSESFYGDI